MGEISTLGGVPNPVLLPTTTDNTTRATKSDGASSAAFGNITEDATTSSYHAQLTKLSSVLSSLQTGSNLIRPQAVTAAKNIKAGTYQVDPLEISKSIVSDLLGPTTIH